MHRLTLGANKENGGESGGDRPQHTHTPVISVFYAPLGLCVLFDFLTKEHLWEIIHSGWQCSWVENARDGEQQKGRDVMVHCV